MASTSLGHATAPTEHDRFNGPTGTSLSSLSGAMLLDSLLKLRSSFCRFATGRSLELSVASTSTSGTRGKRFEWYLRKRSESPLKELVSDHI